MACGLVGVAACLLAVLGGPGWLRVPLGLLFVLGIPGYAFVAALFPEAFVAASEEGPRRGLTGLERAALSLGLSIAIVPLLGLALNFTPLGIRLVPVLLTVGLFSLVCLVVAWVRRQALPEPRRFALVVAVESPAWSTRSAGDRVVSIALVLAVLFASGSLVYVLVKPRPAEAFTELYVLGPTGKASCYPASYVGGEFHVAAADLEAGCPATVRNLTVGILNHEGHAVSYTLRVVWSQERRLVDNTTQVLAVQVADVQTVALESVPVDTSLEASFAPQRESSFVLPAPPFNGSVRLSFLLWKDAGTVPTVADIGFAGAYRRLHLWIDVP